MKFAHLADCHLGGWREQELRDLNIETFRKAVEICIKENVAFVLISGDLLNTSIPSIDLLKEVAHNLRKLRRKNISVYAIPGSHDFSPSGKTMLDVLEKSGLLENVMKFIDNKLEFTLDKTNTKITGLYGKKGALEKNEYELLDKKNLEEEDGFKIFMFHTAIDEFKNDENLKGIKFSFLPKNFNYYAGGHVHYIFNKKVGNSVIAFPGPLFPNNFLEIEELKNGGFYLVNVKEDLDVKYIPINIKEVLSFKINADKKTAKEVEKEILDIKEDARDKIVTLRVAGILESGKPSDINFKLILEKFKEAYSILRNTSKLTTKEFEEFEIKAESVDEVENKIIEEHKSKIKVFEDEKEIVHLLINSLNKEKMEGEKNIDFQNRVLKDVLKVINVN